MDGTHWHAYVLHWAIDADYICYTLQPYLFKLQINDDRGIKANILDNASLRIMHV